MLKKTMTFAFVGAVVFCLAMLTAGVTVASDAGPADITMKSAKAKKPATFPHKKHQDMFKCDQCHHSDDAGKKGPYMAGKEAKCASCHNKEMGNAKLNNLKKAGHALCKKCHTKSKKEGKKAPTKCTGCHPKKK